MAYITSEEYKEKIYDENSFQYLDIYVNDELIEVDRDYVKKISYVNNIFESDSFTLGSTTKGYIELELANEVFEHFDSFDEMTFVFNLELDNGYEEVLIGKYLVKEQDSNSSDFTKFKLYDYMDKFEVPFDASSLVPCTRFQLLQAICNHFNIELVNDSIINGDVLVNSYDNSYTAKTYISFIAERAGGFAKITRDGKLIIKNFSELDEVELPEERAGDYVLNPIKRITRIVYQNATQMFEKGTQDGETIYLSQDNLFSCSQDEVDNIYEVLNGVEFQSLQVKIWGDPSIDVGDVIKLGNIKSFAQWNWEWGNGFYGEYKTDLKEIKNGLSISKTSQAGKIKKIRSDLDELNGKIILLAEEVNGYDEKIAKVEIEAEKIESSVTDIKELKVKIDGSYHYVLTNDTLYKPNKEYYRLVNDEYELMIEGTDYEINAPIDFSILEVYEYVYTAGLSSEVDSLDDKVTENYSEIINKFGEYATTGEIEKITNRVVNVEESTYTKTEIQQIADGTGVDGTKISAVISEIGMFDKNGLLIRKEDKNGKIISDTTGRFNEKGVQVKQVSGGSEQDEIFFGGYVDDNRFGELYKGSSIVYTKNLIADGYTQVGVHGRFEEYTDENNNEGVGFFVI